MYQSFFKPFLDYGLSLLALIILLPFIIIIALVVYFKLGSPILFRQERPGKNEKIFTLYKLRTMTDARDASGELLPDNDRITGFGSFLRKTSLDELPQLFNVFKGDLSFIGPRPLLVEYLTLYNCRQRIRHSVKPGITGWAQVNGRNAIAWEEKFEFDVYYAENLSFLLDLKILVKTLFRVIERSGVDSSSGTTMPKFTGTIL